MKLPNQSDREAWLSWRSQGIGSSDVPAIMNLCPYKTAFDIFEDKTGRVVKADTGNFATERGNRLEPVARQKFAASYNLMHGVDESFQPVLYEHPTLPYMRTSLDGQSFDRKTNIEIKHMGKNPFADALVGLVPIHHIIQIQHQMLVSGATSTWHVAIDENETLATNLIYPDEDVMTSIAEKCEEFWGWVLANRWPTESEDESLLGTFNRYEAVTSAIKQLEVERKQLQEQLFSSGVEICGPWRVNEITRKGNVQYAKVPELKGIDLDRYRAADTVYKTISKV